MEQNNTDHPVEFAVTARGYNAFSQTTVDGELEGVDILLFFSFCGTKMENITVWGCGFQPEHATLRYCPLSLATM